MSSLKIQALEPRILLDAAVFAVAVHAIVAAEHASTAHVEAAHPSVDINQLGTPPVGFDAGHKDAVANIIDPYKTNGKNDVLSWSTKPGASATVTYALDTRFGAFTKAQVDRIHDSVAQITYASNNGIRFVQIADPTKANIDIRNTSTSAAGTASDGVLGSTAYYYSSKPIGTYSNGTALYRMGGQTVVTMLTGRWSWYTGASPIVPRGQYDYQSIVKHELSHAVGLDHNTNSYMGLNGDNLSNMYPSLRSATNGRSSSALEYAELQFLYANGKDPSHLMPVVVTGPRVVANPGPILKAMADLDTTTTTTAALHQEPSTIDVHAPSMTKEAELVVAINNTDALKDTIVAQSNIDWSNSNSFEFGQLDSLNAVKESSHNGNTVETSPAQDKVHVEGKGQEIQLPKVTEEASDLLLIQTSFSEKSDLSNELHHTTDSTLDQVRIVNTTSNEGSFDALLRSFWFAITDSFGNMFGFMNNNETAVQE